MNRALEIFEQLEENARFCAEAGETARIANIQTERARANAGRVQSWRL